MLFDVWLRRKANKTAINRKRIGHTVYFINTDRYRKPMYVYVVNQRWRPFTGSNNVNITDA